MGGEIWVTVWVRFCEETPFRAVIVYVWLWPSQANGTESAPVGPEYVLKAPAPSIDRVTWVALGADHDTEIVVGLEQLTVLGVLNDWIETCAAAVVAVVVAVLVDVDVVGVVEFELPLLVSKMMSSTMMMTASTPATTKRIVRWRWLSSSGPPASGGPPPGGRGGGMYCVPSPAATVAS